MTGPAVPNQTRTEGEIREALKWPNECTEGVTRAGEFQPCEKPAVALRLDPEAGLPYAVCARHARADMVPLASLAASSVAAEARAEKLNEQIENHDDMRLARYSTAERDKARAERDEARARVAQLEGATSKVRAALGQARPFVVDAPDVPGMDRAVALSMIDDGLDAFAALAATSPPEEPQPEWLAKTKLTCPLCAGVLGATVGCPCCEQRRAGFAPDGPPAAALQLNEERSSE